LDRIPLVFGAIYDYEYKDVEPWLVSLKQSGFMGKVALIVYRGSQELIDKLAEQGVHVICFMRTDKGCDCAFDLTNKGIMSIRFLHMWHFLNNDLFLKDVTHVIATDVKDVIFQHNPDKLIGEGSQIVVGLEGFTYDVEPWSKANMKTSFGDEILEMMREVPIVCAGVIVGEKHTISNLFNQVYILTEGSKYPDRVPGGGGPDQSALNIALTAPPWKDLVKHTESILHVGTSMECIATGRGAIGESVFRPDGNPRQAYDYYTSKMLLKSRPRIETDGYVFDDDRIVGEYVIIHQYDRMKPWKDSITTRYKE